jgi:hypothetical protein
MIIALVWLAVAGISGMEGLVSMYAQLDNATLLILLAVAATVIVHSLISARSVRALANKTATQPLSDAKLALYQKLVHRYRGAVAGQSVSPADESEQIDLALLASPRVVEAGSKLQDAIDNDLKQTVVNVRFNALVEAMRIDLGHSPALARKFDASSLVSGESNGNRLDRDDLANGQA